MANAYPSHPHHKFTSPNPVVIFLFCTADVPNDLLTTFIRTSKPGPDRQTPNGLVPYDEEQAFLLVTTRSFTIDNDAPPIWTRPPVEIKDNEFLNASVDSLCDWVRDTVTPSAPGWWRGGAFVVLDERSKEDRATALLVNICVDDGQTPSVRVKFETVLEVARNHSEGLKPDIWGMKEAVDEKGVDVL
ncbi:hypothetical protein MMC06_005921, partial [Schaereria dolodes]|nr:hypothetical protein [Schaereria dolodes]